MDKFTMKSVYTAQSVAPTKPFKKVLNVCLGKREADQMIKNPESAKKQKGDDKEVISMKKAGVKTVKKKLDSSSCQDSSEFEPEQKVQKVSAKNEAVKKIIYSSSESDSSEESDSSSDEDNATKKKLVGDSSSSDDSSSSSSSNDDAPVAKKNNVVAAAKKPLGANKNGHATIAKKYPTSDSSSYSSDDSSSYSSSDDDDIPEAKKNNVAAKKKPVGAIKNGHVTIAEKYATSDSSSSDDSSSSASDDVPVANKNNVASVENTTLPAAKKDVQLLNDEGISEAVKGSPVPGGEMEKLQEELKFLDDLLKKIETRKIIVERMLRRQICLRKSNS